MDWKEELRNRLTGFVGKILGPASDTADVPRPQLGQMSVTGDGRYAPSPISIVADRNKPGTWVIAHRIDKVSIRDYDRVRFYPTVRDGLMAILLPCVRANFHFECSDQRIADAAAQDIGPHISYILEQMLKGGLEWGYSIAEPVWELELNHKVSASQSGVSASETTYPYFYTLKKVAFLSPEDTIVLIWPGNGEFAGVRQFAPIYDQRQRDIPSNRLLQFVHGREFDSNYGVPRTKAAVPFVEQAYALYHDASLYFARFACPSLIGYAPAHTREVGRDSDGKPIYKDNLQTMAKTLTGIRSAQAIVFPHEVDQGGNPKWRVQPLEIGERAQYESWATHLNAMIQASMSVPQLATSVTPDSGTYNLGESQIDLFVQNEEALLDAGKGMLDSQLLDRYRIYNFGHEAPKLSIVFESISNTAMDQLMEGLIENLVQGVPLQTQEGKVIMVDWVKMAQSRGVPFFLQDASKVPALQQQQQGGPQQGGPQPPQGPPPGTLDTTDPSQQAPGSQQPPVTMSERGVSFARAALEGFEK